MYAPDVTLEVDPTLEETKTQLFQLAMKGKWEEVVKIYERKPEAHSAKITWSGDTALHVAVSNCKEDFVKRLVEAIKTCGQRDEEALAVKNDRGNTALHLAASMGNVKMCGHIASNDPSLVGVSNLEGETPLFLTALRGHKDAFLCLHHICGPKQGKGYCQRNDHETVLHCAIAGEYFDLAFQIIHLYKDLAHLVNARGFTPLHILASKPTAFESGSNVTGWKSIIYNLTFKRCLKQSNTSDTESEISVQVDPSEEHKGSMAIIKIKEQKEKHIWSVQIMNKLLDVTRMYEYEYPRSNPQAQHLKGEETKPYEITDGVVDYGQLNNAENINPPKDERPETAILIAAKNGVTEMVKEIRERYPVAVHDMNADKKNIVMLAVEYRQPHVYGLFLEKNILKDIVFHKLDKHGNSALHLAAKLQGSKPWLISGPAFQMQWEVKWYEFVKHSMTSWYLPCHNDENKTPDQLFSETHKDLVKASSKWHYKKILN
ncbi:hypothetical protein FNV43_RR06191 [Rhamnella rubrinervis]|uniref:Uncharacterized protein n=1 Tax=Rhamnella rubrinervis TaxID=2594499 RepID=A0A8K0ML25_9ROSA|nr:hypothetical protein FNV43_RR06191 [Rhamnella rubrinervis]